ncbi:MAG: zinc ribbon domain-containing protein [Gammaproteobacteria bacterium]|nr:zinc ribbon domain-containing protein [Gammaproteobacteria bacterium]
MPTYDYRCPQCNRHFQVHHAMSAPEPHCPGCGASPRRVVLSAPAVHGSMAQGREAAVRTFDRPAPATGHGPSCPCCH